MITNSGKRIENTDSSEKTEKDAEELLLLAKFREKAYLKNPAASTALGLGEDYAKVGDIYYENLGDYPKAVDYYKKAVKYYNIVYDGDASNENGWFLILAYSKLGWSYYLMDDTDCENALKCFHAEEDILEELCDAGAGGEYGDIRGYAHVYYELAEVYRYDNRISAANDMLSKHVSLAELCLSRYPSDESLEYCTDAVNKYKEFLQKYKPRNSGKLIDECTKKLIRLKKTAV